MPPRNSGPSSHGSADQSSTFDLICRSQDWNARSRSIQSTS